MMRSFSSCLSGDPTNLPSPVRDCRRASCSGAVSPAARCARASARPGGRRAVVAAVAARAAVRASRPAQRVVLGAVLDAVLDAVPGVVPGAAAVQARARRPEHWACATPLRGDAPSRRGFDRLRRCQQASASVPTAPRARGVRDAARQRAARRVLQAARAPERACAHGRAGASVPDAPKARRRAPPKYRAAAVPALPAACRLAAVAAKPALRRSQARSSAPAAPAAAV